MTRFGSTIGLTDNTGAIVREYSYDPDGNATSTGNGGCAAGLATSQGARGVGSALARRYQRFNGYTAVGSCAIGAVGSNLR